MRRPGRTTSPTRHGLLAAGFYVGVALWTLRVVVAAPASTAALPLETPPAWRQITAADQKLVIAMIASHGRALLHAPSTLLDGPQCYPLPRALALGQHELGEGLLGFVPYVLSRDPVFTYNATVILSIALAGLTMHLLVLDWTGSAVAALVAGFLFAIHPARVGDLQHLSAIANYGTLLTLFFLVRLFTRQTWGAAAGLGASMALQTLESIYPLIPHAIVTTTLGVWLGWRHRGDARALFPKLGLVGLMALGTVVVVLGPYLAFRGAWGSLSGRAALLFAIGDFRPGHAAYPGTVALGLACVGLVDRFHRQSTDGPQPHGALVIAGLLVFWAAVSAIPVPGLGYSVPSLFTILATFVPGLDAIRRGGTIISGLYLVTIVLAGYGAAAVVRGRSALVRGGLAAVLMSSVALEVFVPALARASFGRSVTLKAYVVRPPEKLLALCADLGPGAVLDLPYELGPGRFFRMADFVLAGAYHGHRVAACYNSFRVAVQDDVAKYAARVLNDAKAAEALAALDIRYVVYHLTLPSRLPQIAPVLVPSHLAEVGRTGTEVLYRITSDPAPTSLLAALEVRVEATAGTLDLVFTNTGSQLYRHPDPIVPTPLRVRWHSDEFTVVREDEVAVPLPTALVPGDTVRRSLRLTLPPPDGAHRLTVVTADDPKQVLATVILQLARGIEAPARVD